MNSNSQICSINQENNIMKRITVAKGDGIGPQKPAFSLGQGQ